LTPEKADATARYKKIVYQQQALDELLTDLFLNELAAFSTFS
jgi:cytochrome b involved in lipid metabolism